MQINWSTFRNDFFKLVKKYDKKLVNQIPNASGAANILYNLVIRQHSEEGRKLIDKFCQDYENKFYLGHEPNKELITFIKANYKRYSLYLWTANQLKTVNKVVDNLNIRHCFKKIISATDVAFNKPEPEGFYQFFDPKHHEKENYLMIGDSDHDMNAARNAGIDFFKWVDT